MSLTTSSANADPPPLLFGQQSPAPRSNSTPPPTTFGAAQTPSSHSLPAQPALQHSEGITNLPSTVLQSSTEAEANGAAAPAQPNGQNHDRDVKDEDDDAWTEYGDSESGSESNILPQNNFESTRRTSSAPPARYAPTLAAGITDITSSVSTETNNPVTATAGATDTSNPIAMDTDDPPIVPAGNQDQVNTAASTNDTSVIDNMPPLQESNARQTDAIAVPPEDDDESDIEDEDDNMDDIDTWEAIEEDHSAPSESELKEIEAGDEHSALDLPFWEAKTGMKLDQPEYKIGTSGHFEWPILHYRGTQQDPNRDLVMKSQIAEIGGHTWQMKFYPRGNDSDHLSVYVECLSVMQGDDTQQTSTRSSGHGATGHRNVAKGDSEMRDAPQDEATQIELQHAPLPLLGMKSRPKRRSVAAQVSVVLYNPTEPRVHAFSSCDHRFCEGSPDWGWTRFYGPFYTIHKRRRLQRMAMLRDDKLTLRCFVRIIEDSTDCLWEHPTASNPWDAFAMTGLQGLMPLESNPNYSGNFISAISIWMNLRPFRELLYEAQELITPLNPPKPLLLALQKVLYQLRTRISARSGCVKLDCILRALAWYNADEGVVKFDVIGLWGLLRSILQQELADTNLRDRLTLLFGPPRTLILGGPRYRVPVRDVRSVQNAVKRSIHEFPAGDIAPRLLTVELARQDYDVKSRCWRKLADDVKLDEHIIFGHRKVSYTLFGFVAHKDGLQSGRYYSVVRPDGPGGKWYQYGDGKESRKVLCLTKYQALTKHKGSDQATGPVAYIVVYIRDDIARNAFPDSPEADWDVPAWLEIGSDLDDPSDEDMSELESIDDDYPDGIPEDQVRSDERAQTKDDPIDSRTVTFTVFDSRAFSAQNGPGIINPYDDCWSNSDYTHEVEVPIDCLVEELKESVAEVLPTCKETRQLRLYTFDQMRGTYGFPKMYPVMSRDETQHHDFAVKDIWTGHSIQMLWSHVIPLEVLNQRVEDGAGWKSGPPAQPIQTDGRSASALADGSEDTVMSDADVEPEAPAMPTTVNPPAHPATPSISAPPPAVPSNANSENANVATISNRSTTPPTEPPQLHSTTPTGPVPESQIISAGAPIPPPPPPPAPRSPIELEEVYLMVKRFDIKQQDLVDRTCILLMQRDKFLPAIRKAMSLPADAYVSFFREHNSLAVTPLHVTEDSVVETVINRHAEVVIIRSPDPYAKAPNQSSQPPKKGPDTTFAKFASAGKFVDPHLLLKSIAKCRNRSELPTSAAAANARCYTFRARPEHNDISFFNAEQYRGQIAHGSPHGPGHSIDLQGQMYTGQYAMGLRHGRGSIAYTNGDVYEGDLSLNNRHGKGTLRDKATGNVYVGGWKADKPHGEGVTHWKVALENSEKACRICFEDEADSAFYDCGHVVACASCAARVESCPICRKSVSRAIKLYYA